MLIINDIFISFVASQSPGDHTVRVEFLNHTGETIVTLGNTGATDGGWENETHNPPTGGGQSGNLWMMLLAGCMGGVALMRRLKPVR